MPDILYKGTISLSVLSLEDDGGHFEKETLGFKARENSKNVSYFTKETFELKGHTNRPKLIYKKNL